ncbi:amino acid adenylation domain-containing protein [Paraburkholderia caffeinilytica]|uniref:amino acid adenylation domain-containing protein n=1 Tax=Paraburkholderia caffeinilytica TaxID=1761016 RepID=UPI0038BBCA55
MSERVSEVPMDLRSISAAYVALPVDKRRAFRDRLRARGIDAARLPIVPFPDAGRRFPLSYAQERLWFLWRLDPASAAYNVTGAVRLRGRLDVAALRAALDRVVDAHESLRQRFEEIEGVPYQRPGPRDYGWQTHALDASASDTAPDVSDALEALLARSTAEPFDLEHGPLLRVVLIALAPDDYVLHVALHHIVSDGLSVEVFVAELADAYRAHVEPSTAPDAPARELQYGDYAQWQREWLDDGTLGRQLDYWRNRLGTEHPVLELPRTQARAGMRSGAGARLVRVVPETLRAALARVSLAADATPFVTLLAAYDLLLARYSGQQDIRVGVPVAGRERPEVARTIGFFVNTLVIRTELAGVPTFAALLAQVRERVLEAHAHADLPFTKLVDALQPQRSFGETPLFQAMFNYLGVDRDAIQLPGLDVSNHELDTRTARFDLVLDARERPHGLEVALTYAEDRFDAATIAQMLDHYVRLLEQIAADAAQPLGAFALSDEVSGVPAPVLKPYVSVPARFAASVARQPQALAVHCEGEATTYAALDAQAARVAHALARAGVRPDERVGLCMTRSIGMVAALLGTLRSPGAFVPLDPTYPAERLAMMMEDAGVRVVLTDAAAAAQCGALFADRIAIAVDALDDVANANANAAAPRAVDPHPDQLAYVIYTSGSTGRPKGVAIAHGAFAAHLDDFIATHGIDATDTQLQSSTINFDVALHELLPALLCGGKVEMRGPQPWDIETTSCHLIDARVTFSRLPTAYWQQWLRSPPPAASLALRQITVGGEGLPGDALAQWRAGPLGHIGVANLYGPTETTVACMFRATTADDTAQPIVSIGAPYASRSARVLDHDGNDAPVGALGELCIGGHTLARGYLDRPSLTAERFVPDPAGLPGARLYRTGDLCRRRADGAIDFLGRLDQQIKLRGFRIEPGEVEAALRRQPGVADAVAMLATTRGVARLVAYAVPRADAAPLDGATLQQALAQALPAHMVPAAIAVLERLPLMPNGKVDRAALPAIEEARSDTPRAAPRNDAERTLLALWCAVLGRDDLGIDDDFFAAGGDSILSLQLIAKARAQGWLLTPRQVFEQPSVARLAAVMRPLELTGPADEIREPLPLTPIQAWFFSRYPDGERHWNQSVLLRVRGELDVAAFERALGAVIARHDALRLCFERDEDGVTGESTATAAIGAHAANANTNATAATAARSPGWRQRVLADAPAGIVSSVDLREAGEGWQAALAEVGERAQRALDPAAGRLVNAVSLRTPNLADGTPDGRLLLVIHHLAVDGVSWRILLTDLQAAYAVAREGRAPSLEPALPWSAWVIAQRDAATEARIAHALPAWQAALREAQSGLDAPVGTAASSDVIDWKLDREATDALRRAAPRAYRLGVDELLLAALARAAAATFGGDGALVALEGHGRDVPVQGDADPSRTVGWFTTRYPAWLPAPAADAAALLGTKSRLRALPDGGASWGWLHTYGDTATRDTLAALPAPRLSFNYLGQFDGSLAADGPFGFATEASGNPQPADEPLVYPVDVNGMIVDGQLSFSWRFDPAVVSPQRQHALVAAFSREVARFVAHCEHATPRASAADFPRARLDDMAFDALGLANEALDDLYPATPLQQGLLFHSLLENGAYLNRKRLTLSGDVDIDALRTAWSTVIARHPVLRTRFVRGHGGAMLQAVLSAVPVPFEVHDWRTRADYDAAFARWFDDEAPRRVDLDRAPLMHVAMFRRPDGAHDLAWLNHHALSDGWSQSQLLGELTRAYVAARQGVVPALDPVVPFGAYVDWLDAQPDTGDWWRAQLARVDRPALLLDSVALLPARAAHAAHEPQAFRHRATTLDAGLSAALADAARRHGVTLNTLIQAAWAIVLARHGNRRQAAFGVTVAGRPSDLPGAAAIQGVFINSLPLWVDVPADRPLGDWLHALQHQNVELRQVEHTPLTSIQQWAGAGFGVLFDSLLVFENYPIDPALKDGSLGLTVEASASFERTHYPLTLGVLPGERIGLEWSWDSGRLPDASFGIVADAYEAVLAQLAHGSATTLAALRVPGRIGEEGAAMAPGAAHPYRSVVARIDAVVRARPDALAIRCDDMEMTYGELDALATRIARRLVASGVGCDMTVGVCIERSPALLAALVGVLKAGGAYVPLDPSYPRERLRDMCEDARFSTILTDAATDAAHADWIGAAGCEAIRVDGPLDRSRHGQRIGTDAALPGEPWPNQLAYVIYTSGSTGRPKGVALTHGALSLHLDDFIADNELTPDDHVLQFTTVNFDTSIEEIFGSLAAGTSLEMRGPAIWSGAELSRVLVERRVTVADFPTGYWKQWMRQATEPLPGLALRRVTVIGEALPGTAVAQWFAGPLADVPFINNYGPTETAITSSDQRVEPAHVDCVAVPIGRPRASRVYRILDLDGMPAPEGGIGELCIGGDTLARGYLRRPSLSAERFAPDPFGPPGSRVYRTGDLCRWLPDGSVAYVGRLDDQVKVRGYRIELGEIENVLVTQPGVAEAVAIVRGEQDAKRLFAYVVAAPHGPVPDGDALRDALSQTLPSYMVPAAIAVLDALPTLPNGKLDRKSLPSLEAVAAAYVAPATPLEAIVAEVWQAVLGLERVGASDDFFALGGHSLLALQVAARLQRALGRDVPLRALLDHPVLAALAAWLHVSASPAARSLPPVRRLGRRDVRPTHGQERLWFLWRLAPESAAYHLSLAVQLDGVLDEQALRAALDGVVARHEMLHARFDERDGEPWLVVDDNLRAGWETASFASADEAALTDWLRDGANRPFDLARGPLLRARLARTGDAAHVFSLALHHIAADGWSLNVLIDELIAAYDALVSGKSATLAPLPVQYTDYAVWQRETLDAAALGAQLDYWRTTLGDEQPVLELPADRPRPAQRDARGGQLESTLARPLADALQAYARRHDATLFMTLLAAFHALLYRYGGQRDIRVGIPLAGRERLEVEPLIGFFVNTAVIRAELSGALPFDALLAQVKQRVLDAQANQDVPFAQIVDALQPVRAANHTPLFQALFNLEVKGGSAERETSGGLRLRPFGGERTAAQFDLSLGVSVGEQIGLTFSYAADLFDATTVERLSRDYLALLEQLVRDADRNADQSADTSALRLRDFTLDARPVAQRGDAPVLPFVPVDARIAATARRQPDALAVRCDGAALSYRELDARVDALAARLTQVGLVHEARIGVCVTRSLSMIVAVLAVMRAGGAYVPLDPAYPDAHLAGMIDDAGLLCTVVDEVGHERLAGLGGAPRCIDVDVGGNLDVGAALSAVSAVSAGLIEPAKRAAIVPDQLAYVIYTSGSTGRPKGVGVTHGALTRFLDSMQARLAPTRDDVWLAVTTLSFDIAGLEMYLPLIAGATIELATRETVVDGRRLAALADASGATLMQATPMGWRMLLDGGWLPRAPFVALSGGEALPPDLADALQVNGARLWNLYGPTETTIWSSAARLDERGAPITLGAPLEHTTLLVLDADGNPVPENGIGELCIGGANLARGYLGRPGQSAERFVPDPSGPPGARVYRTGDLCRVGAGGRLESLGRADQQVKLRGFRIELGATEVALRTLDGVTDAACQIQGEGTARRLVAFVTGEVEAAALRARLADSLPAQQVPAQIVRLDTLPRTSNGKLNRAALPAVAAGDADAYAAPGTATEALVCQIWADVLGVERVGIDDDFFALGGHSLVAVRGAARLGDALGLKVEIALVFAHPKVADLAAQLDGAAPDEGMTNGSTSGTQNALDGLQDLLDSL